MLRYGHNGSVHAFCLSIAALSLGMSAALAFSDSARYVLRAERPDFRTMRPRRRGTRGKRHTSLRNRSNRRKASGKK